MIPTDFSGRRVSIMGLGRSGLAVARTLSALGARVFISDTRSQEELGELWEHACRLPGVEIETGCHSQRLLEGCDLLVLSPGVSVHHPLVQLALKQGRTVTGEVELAYHLSPVPFIAVTGTNGKSTTATLIHKFLEPRSILAGNIGVPLIEEVSRIERETKDWIVAEISSFQLETVLSFRPRIAVCTNITADHLDRHTCFEEYFAAKARLFSFLTSEDKVILNGDDQLCRKLGELLVSGHLPAWLPGFGKPRTISKPEVCYYSVYDKVPRGIWLSRGKIFIAGKEGDPEYLMPWPNDSMVGPVRSNALAAIFVAWLLGVATSRIEAVLQSFKPLHFRLEEVGRIKGVRFINDSKATNVASVIAALNSFEDGVVLIAGGKDKGADFESLARVVAVRCKHVVLIGESASKIGNSVKAMGLNSIHYCDTLRDAVLSAYRLAYPEGVVLLSPACASFDMFDSAEDRGQQFNRLVAELSISNGDGVN